MSNKYKKQMDLIVMSEEVKKRILYNTLNADKQPMSKKNSKNEFYKKSMGVLVACLSILICINLRVFFLKIFGFENNKNTNNIEMKQRKDKNNNLYNNKENEDNNNGMDDLNKNIKKDNIKNESKSSSIIQKEDINNTDLDSKNNIIELPEKEVCEANESLDKNIEKHDDNNETTKGNEIQTHENTSAPNDEMRTASYDISLAKSRLKEHSNLKQVDTIEEAQSEVGFTFKTLRNLPKGFNIDNIEIIPNNLVKIDYKNDKNILSLTIENSVENKYEEYNMYPFEKNININQIEVTLKGYDNNLIIEANWNNENISYSICNINGITESDLSDIIDNIK